MFKQFGFLDATREINTQGIGLGLHICKLLVEQFNGSVSCISKYGEGSTFTFTFQLSKTEVNQPFLTRNINPYIQYEIMKKVPTIMQKQIDLD